MLARLHKAREEADESGFTLIELLIVIVILGILAAIVVFSVGGITDKGTASACQTDVKIVDTAAEAFYAQPPAAAPHPYATTIGDLVTYGFLHGDSVFKPGSGTSVSTTGSNPYTITFTPGTATSAGDAVGTPAATCTP
jgi:general secretion pathway protein G